MIEDVDLSSEEQRQPGRGLSYDTKATYKEEDDSDIFDLLKMNILLIPKYINNEVY